MMSEVNSNIVPNTNHTQSGYIKAQPKSVDLTHAIPVESKPENDPELLVSPGQLAEKVGQLNDLVIVNKRAIFFTVDTASGKDVVTVTNLTTGELIRQIPTVEALKAMQNMDTMMGFIFNQKT